MSVKKYVADEYWVDGYTETVFVPDPQRAGTQAPGAIGDATISWDAANNCGDWSMNGSLLATGNDLQTAIIISIFSDRLALPGDVIPDGSNNPRGWWADGTVLIGSRIWLLRRSKQTQDTLQRAFDYLSEALQWMLDDGVVGRFDISVEWVRRSVLGAQIVAYKQDGTTLLTGRYAWTWDGLQ